MCNAPPPAAARQLRGTQVTTNHLGLAGTPGARTKPDAELGAAGGLLSDGASDGS